MGTRSITHVKNEQGIVLLSIYRQYDGYPTGQGKDIKECFEGKRLVDGYTSKDSHLQVNGMDRAAIMLAGHLNKPDDPGNVYAAVPGRDNQWCEFTYTLGRRGKAFHLRVEMGDPSMVTLYDGPLEDFNPEKVEEKAYE